MDLQEVFRTYEVIQRAEKMLRRPIPARVALTQMSPLQSRVAQHARQEIQSANIPVLRTEILQRAAYRSIHYTGATPSHPDGNPKPLQKSPAPWPNTSKWWQFSRKRLENDGRAYFPARSSTSAPHIA